MLTLALPNRGPARVLLVADRRDERDEALRELLAQLLVAGIGALVVTAVVGERLAKAALVPVERYRSKAASIAAGASGVRLDVPQSRDDEVTRLGHTLNDVLDALEHAVDAERRFTQDASHELRTPLTLLSTRIQLALRRSRTAAEHEAMLRELGQDVTALSSLARAAAAAEHHRRRAPHQRLRTCRRSGGGRRRGRARAPGGRAGRRPAGDRAHRAARRPAAGRTVRARAAAVLTNLIGNALLHGHRTAVRVRVTATAGAAVLTVTDGGPGVAAAFLPTATDRFARADTARGRPGAGLGLSLVRSLVERFGGELRLCSAGVHHRYADRLPLPCTHPASGTTVSVLLPLL